MKVKVKKFFVGGLVNLGADALNGIGEASSGVGQSLTTLGGINNKTDVGRQQALANSASGSAFDKQRKKDETGNAVFEGFQSSLQGIPLVGGLLKGVTDLGKGAVNLFRGPEDEFGITKGKYRRNDDLARGRDTFRIGETNEAISDMQTAGANIAANTPTFQAPQFGKFGMKFKRFR